MEVSSEGAGKIRCEECFRTYDTVLQLQKHKYNVHKNPNRLLARNDSFGNPVYECEFCGETYDTPKLLMKHRYNVHRNPHQNNVTTAVEEQPGKQGFACSECPRAFETPRQLQKHKYNVHKTGRKVPVQVSGVSQDLYGEVVRRFLSKDKYLIYF